MANKYRKKIIPPLDNARGKIISFRNVPINFSSALTNEGYVDIKEAGLSGFNHYFKSMNPPYYTSIKGSTEKLLLRKSVVLKLIRINNKLNKDGLELYFFDCYRPVKVQQFLYNVWLPKYLKRIHPNYSEEKLLKELNLYTAKPPISENDIDRNSPSPHATGAAMDVTLRFKESKEQLFMGSIFDDTSKLVNTDYFEAKNLQHLTLSDEEALKNRRILYHSMKEEGIENYPFEWWHYSWGDQMWAILSGEKEAFYSNMIL